MFFIIPYCSTRVFQTNTVIFSTLLFFDVIMFLLYIFFLNGNGCNDTNTYGLPSNNSALPISAMKAFEEDLAQMIESVSFRKVNDPFLDTIKKDIQKVNSSKKSLYSLIKREMFMKLHRVRTISSLQRALLSLTRLALKISSIVSMES